MLKIKKPNLLFIFADQWRRQAMGFMNEDSVITPNIDKFAEESMVFDNAVSCCPLCSPHRAALFSGRYPISNGVFTNCKIGADVMLDTNEICIGDVLKEAGYDTGYIGKWHLDLPELNISDNPESGARGWDAYTPPGPKRHGFDFWYSYGTCDEHMSPHYWRNSPQMIKINQWSPEHETDAAIDYIKNREKEKPFSLFISLNPPHSPYEQVPQKYKEFYKDKEICFRPNVKTDNLKCHTGEKFDYDEEKLTEIIKDYYAAVTGIDENFGRLLETLKEQGIDEDTIVVLSSDHGDLLGSHGMMAKHIWYEESIGIPFIINFGSKIKAGRTDALLNSVDVMPTLLSLMGINIPDAVEGKDISPVLSGNKAENIDSAFIAAYPGRKNVLEEFAVLGINNIKYGWRAVRTLRYTYVVNNGYIPGGRTERLLYDNVDDPYQMNPVRLYETKANPVADQLEGKLKHWILRLKDPFII